VTPVEVVGPSNILGAYPPIPQSVIKSAGRVMQIMEFFDNVQRPASAVEVGSTLGYPQSSTSMLLHSMSAMGYLHHYLTRRTYVPTNRLALAGAWLNDRLLEKGPVLGLMEELHKLTGQAVLLSMRHGIFGQYIHVVQAVQTVGHLVVGTKRHLTSTGTGYVLLSTLPDKLVQLVVHSINADAGGIAPPVKLAEVLDTVSRLRRDGYLQASSLTIKGGASIAMPLRGTSADNTLAIAVFGAADTIEANLSAFLDLMRDATSRYRRRFDRAGVLDGAV
jgi:DNA-binding IclR family transcriptional regulator